MNPNQAASSRFPSHAQLTRIDDTRLRLQRVEPLPERRSGGIAVTLESVSLHAPFFEEHTNEGLITVMVGDMTTVLPWPKRVRRGASVFRCTRRHLIYAGQPGAALALGVDVLESDENERDRLKKLKRMLSAVAPFGLFIPSHAPAALAGLTLGSALADLGLAGIDHEYELRYRGMLSRHGDTGVPLGPGKYVLTRTGNARSAEEAGVEIGFTVSSYESASTESQTSSCLLVLEHLELDTRGIAHRDVVSIAATAVGGPEKERLTQSVELPVLFEPAITPGRMRTHAPLVERLGVQDAVLYHGPVGTGIDLSLKFTAAPRKSIDAELDALGKALEAGGAFASELRPMQGSMIMALSRAAGGAITLGSLLAPDRSVAAAGRRIIVHGSALRHVPEELVLIEPCTQCQCVEIPIMEGDQLRGIASVKVINEEAHVP